MEALIPKLFIITAEASLVLFLILLVIIVFNIKAKRKDLKAANKLISDYVNSKEERLATIKTQLKKIGFSGNIDEQAEQLYNQERSLLKDFVSIYLRRDTYRLLDYPDSIMEVDDRFLKTSGSGNSSPDTSEVEAPLSEDLSSEENANATILAREQAESNEAHLKELSELRLKNTELNEHLFEALETITTLMTEHGKKTGQEVETNAQKILEAIIYLRDNRLGNDTDPSILAPPPDDGHDQIEDPWSVDLANSDGTLDDSTAVNLGISEELNTDLDSLNDEADVVENTAGTATQTEESEQAPAEEGDPWGDALAEQAATETQEETQTEQTASAPSEEDPWADALAEQAATEETPAEEEDPWADALAEQAATEAETDSSEEDDPWAAALAEQEKSEKK